MQNFAVLLMLGLVPRAPIAGTPLSPSMPSHCELAIHRPVRAQAPRGEQVLVGWTRAQRPSPELLLATGLRGATLSEVSLLGTADAWLTAERDRLVLSREPPPTGRF